MGGGGGGGGVQSKEINVTPDQEYKVIVGVGGIAGINGVLWNGPDATNGGTGGKSFFGGFGVSGGGGGFSGSGKGKGGSSGGLGGQAGGAGEGAIAYRNNLKKGSGGGSFFGAGNGALYGSGGGGSGLQNGAKGYVKVVW